MILEIYLILNTLLNIKYSQRLLGINSAYLIQFEYCASLDYCTLTRASIYAQMQTESYNTCSILWAI